VQVVRTRPARTAGCRAAQDGLRQYNDRFKSFLPPGRRFPAFHLSPYNIIFASLSRHFDSKDSRGACLY